MDTPAVAADTSEVITAAWAAVGCIMVAAILVAATTVAAIAACGLAPAANDKPIEYTLNGLSFTMKPGQSQKFNHDRDWIVGFDRGDGKGSAQYGLKAATYKFKMTEKGWELFEAATPEPPTAAAQGEEPKPIDLVKPVEKTVPLKGTDETPTPAPAQGEGDAK